jgi:hypothetical protein
MRNSPAKVSANRSRGILGGRGHHIAAVVAVEQRVGQLVRDGEPAPARGHGQVHQDRQADLGVVEEGSGDRLRQVLAKCGPVHGDAEHLADTVDIPDRSQAEPQAGPHLLGLATRVFGVLEPRRAHERALPQTAPPDLHRLR